MLFSRNPISGEMETYSDEGVYAGHVFTMGDFVTKEKNANDGGPGSGNWGHSGRPGKRGGSGKGSGGKEFRAGSKEEGYHRNEETRQARKEGRLQVKGPERTAKKSTGRKIETTFTGKSARWGDAPSKEYEKRYKKAQEMAKEAFKGNDLDEMEDVVGRLAAAAEQSDAWNAGDKATRSAERFGIEGVPAEWPERLDDDERAVLEGISKKTADMTAREYGNWLNENEKDAKLMFSLQSKLLGAEIEPEITKEALKEYAGQEEREEIPGQLSMFAGENVPAVETGKLKETSADPEELTEDPDFDIFEWLANGGGEETEEEKAARKEKAQKEEKEQKERERYGNNGLLESDYPENLRLSDKERDLIADVFREYKDDDFNSDASAEVIDALSGLMTKEHLDQKEKALKQAVEDCTEEIARKKAEGYSYKTHNPQAKETRAQKLGRWWNEVLEYGTPLSNWGEKGIRFWQTTRADALKRLGQINTARKIVERNEFAKEQPGYMPWRKNPNRDNPSYRPWESEDEFAEDGGPGSGNFGHRGRPGKRGGSAKGTGGGQYRGGRSDIGYYGSRNDWLNGLSGEKQAKATKIIKEHKAKLEKAAILKKSIEEKCNKGLLTYGEKDELFKKNNLDKLKENSTPEQFCMAAGSLDDRKELMDLAGEARKWDKKGKLLQEENLSEDEKKYLGTLAMNHMTDFGNGSEEDFANFNLDSIYDKLSDDEKELYLDLKAKAMGLPDSGKKIDEYSDELQYDLGVKERPKKPEGPDYSWYDTGNSRTYVASNMEYYMTAAIGDRGWPGKLSKEEFMDLNQKFVDHMKYGLCSPNEISYAGMRAIAGMRAMIAGAKNPGGAIIPDLDYTPEMVNRLTDDEKKRMMEIAEKYLPNPYYSRVKSVEDLDQSAYEAMEIDMRKSTPRTKVDRKLMQDYVLMQEKMMIGAEPMSDEKHDEIVKKADEEKKRKEEEKKRQEEEKKQQVISGQNTELQAEFRKNRENRMKAYDEAITTHQVSKTMSDSGMLKGSVYMPGASVECAREIAKSYERVMEKYPFLIGEFAGIDEHENGASHIYASCTMISGGLHLNSKNWFSDMSKLTAQYQSDVNSGYHPAGTKGTSIITHEIGHAMDGYLSQKGFNGAILLGSDAKNFSGILRRSVLKSLKKTKHDVGRELSRYAMKNAHEWFAECFAEAMTSENPRPMAAEMMRQLDEILKKEGLLSA